MMEAQETIARVDRVEYLTPDILQLSLVPEQNIPFYAGQYLQIQLQEKVYFFSIANAALEKKRYILHIRLNKDSFLDKHLLTHIQEEKRLTVRLPFGACHVLRIERKKPVLFLAFGTGFAQVHAMIEQFAASEECPSMHLVWCVRSQRDLYLDEKVKQWENCIPGFRYVPLLTEQPMESLFPLLLSTEHTIKRMQIVMSGAFDMVYAIRSRLVQHGVETRNLFSDAFEFEVKL